MTMSLANTTIFRALEPIGDECGWVQGTHAVCAEGRPVDPICPRAVRFCAKGAMLRAGYDLTGNPRPAASATWRAASCLRAATMPTMRPRTSTMHVVRTTWCCR